MKILIIEDNIEFANNIQKRLKANGFQVETTNSGIEGEQLAFINKYDVILLDLNLPDKDGLSVLNFLRSESMDVPIIIISARDEIQERTLGLNQGADDYLIKPFNLSELIARIHAVTRRFHGKINPNIQIGSLIISPAQYTVTYEGKPIILKTKEFDMLVVMAYSHPEVLSLEEIANYIYDENVEPSSSVLRVHIARLKNALNTAAGNPIMKTIRGKGYQLCEKITID